MVNIESLIEINVVKPLGNRASGECECQIGHFYQFTTKSVSILYETYLKLI